MTTHQITRPTGRARAWVAAALAAALVSAGAIAVATSANAAPANLSQGKIATASSVEGADVNASKSVDGNNGTRWASQFADNQYLQVDLGAPATLSSVVLRWEAAYAKSFQVQVSDNGSTWSTAASVTNGTGGNQTINVTGSARYVKLNLQTRGTGYGFSLWEFQVFGTGGSTTPPLQPEAPAAGTSGRRHLGDAPRVPGELHPRRTPCRTTRSSTRARRAPRTATRSWATGPPTRRRRRRPSSPAAPPRAARCRRTGRRTGSRRCCATARRSSRRRRRRSTTRPGSRTTRRCSRSRRASGSSSAA